MSGGLDINIRLAFQPSENTGSGPLWFKVRHYSGTNVTSQSCVWAAVTEIVYRGAVATLFFPEDSAPAHCKDGVEDFQVTSP